MSPSPQLCRCLPKRRRVPTHGRRQHSWWSEPSPPGGTARLATGMPRRRPLLSSGPTFVWRQPSLSAALRGRQRAARSFWRSGCGSRICAILLRDTATLRLDLPPPRAALAGSPPDRGRAWWEPWASIQAGVSRQRKSRPARTQGHSSLTENAWRSPTRLMEVSAVKSAVLRDRNFSSTEGAPLKSSQDDREVPRGHKGRPGGISHFQGGGWQPTLQPFLQERKHYSNRASSGVFSARRTPGREQTPFQCVGLPCWRSSSLNDGLYHRRW